MSEVKSKRDIIIEAIEAGGATMESLQVTADCKYASIMSNFSMLRLMGKCPVKDVAVTVKGEDGTETTEMTYRLVSLDEWEKIKAEKAEKAASSKTATKSPKDQYALLTARVKRCKETCISAKERLAKDEKSVILGLRLEKAIVENKIAQFEMKTFSSVPEHAEVIAAVKAEQAEVKK